MTTDRETGEVIRSWMGEPTTLSDAGLHRVLAQLPATPQRRHRWLPTFPAPLWRAHTMFSATKFIATGSIVALFAGLLSFTLPKQEQVSPLVPVDSTSPGASMAPVQTDEGERTEPAFFAGDLDFSAGTGGCMSIAGGGFCSRTYSIGSDVSGARLAGQGVAHALWPFEGASHPGPHEGSLRIENEHGAWNGVIAPRGASDDHYGVWLVGEGDYQGLTAFMYATAVDIEEAREDMHWQVDGWLFSDEPVAPPPLTEE